MSVFLLSRPFHWIDKPASDPCPAQTQSRLETGCERQVKNPPASEQGRRAERLLAKQTTHGHSNERRCHFQLPASAVSPSVSQGRQVLVSSVVVELRTHPRLISRQGTRCRHLSSPFISAAPELVAVECVCAVRVCAPRLSLVHSLAEKCPHPAGSARPRPRP